jgi:hypothetical protein
MGEPDLISAQSIERAILLVRGRNVMLDRDLAALYRVTTGNPNKAVSRNVARFPDDFMFLLTGQELRDLIFHSGTSSWGGPRKPPGAFTEQGVAMRSSVLRSPRAAQMNVAFDAIRGLGVPPSQPKRRIGFNRREDS